MTEIPVVNKADSRKGMLAAAIYVAVVAFLLFFLTYSIADPPKVTVPLPIKMGDIGIENFEIDNGGGGTPEKVTNPTPVKKETPKKQPTQDKSPVTVPSGTGKSDNATSNTSDETAPNPFSGSGSGGSGTAGSGGGFGSDNGPGGGTGDPGLGSGGNRKLLTHSITKPSTINNETGVVAFYLTVDARGAVLRVDVVRKNTTINNQRLIDELKEIVKKEVKFNQKPGARNVRIYYTVKVTPS